MSIPKTLTLLLSILPGILLQQASASTMQNDRYRLELLDQGALRIHSEGKSADFLPEFTILYRPDNPKFVVRPKHVPNVSYSVETWVVDSKNANAAVEETVNVMAGDGWEPRILKGDQEGRTADVFKAGNRIRVSAKAVEMDGEKIRWIFDDKRFFKLSATLTLPVQGEPILSVSFIPDVHGWFSVGYTGAPSIKPESADEFFQPPFWTRKRFPERSYLTTHRATLPSAMVGAQGQVAGVIADPSLIPFQPLPTFDNTRFGLSLRNAEGQAQPILFSPALGGANSEMNPGEKYSFDLRLFVIPGNIDHAYEYLARSLYGVRDYRRNSLCSVNTTINNILDYAFTTFSLFDEELRGSSYETDLPNSVNNVSGLHPLAFAVIFDEEEIYQRRALPMLEAGLSRTKRLFSSDPGVKGHSDWTLNGPNMPGSELAIFNIYSQGRAKALLDLAKEITRGRGIIRNLELYRATGEKDFLKKAEAAAQSEIQKTEEALSNVRISTWTFRTPWIPLTELYEETGDRKYLEAAVTGGREYTQFLWMCPKLPGMDEEILVNPGGRASLYGYMKSKGKQAMPATEGPMPAWRSSEIGLTSEATASSSGHRAVFLASPMTWMLRLGQRADVPFFRDLARSALVGRSMSFPGYHLNTARTDVYEKKDYPLRPLKELSYNSFHFNHIWPHAAMLLDYLITDIEGLSKRQIRFPGHYVEAYSYLMSRVYGADPGRFFDQREAWLWMPRDLALIDNVEINWLAARSEGGLCIAFSNQSHETQRFTVTLDSNRLPSLKGKKRARRWTDAKSDGVVQVTDGTLTLDIAPRGLVALRFPDVKPEPGFQKKLLNGKHQSEGGRISFDFGGGGDAYLLSMGEGLNSAYAFLRAAPGTYGKVALEAKLPGSEEWQRFEDNAYPHEFRVPLPDGADFVFRFVAIRADNEQSESSTEYRIPCAEE